MSRSIFNPKKIFSWIYIFLPLFFTFQLYPQQIRFKHLTINDGLSQSSVSAILQDKSGFMWFGTKDGLDRYDGYNFKVFYNHPFDSTSISPNQITALFEDHKGVIWIGTLDGKVDFYEKENQRFHHIGLNSEESGNSNIIRITAIAEDDQKNIWIGTMGNGLYELAFPHGRKYMPEVTHFINFSKDNNSLGSNDILSLHLDSLKNLWIGTDQNILKFNEKQNNFTKYKIEQAGAEFPGIFAISEFKKGFLWLGISHGLVLFNEKTGEYKFYFSKLNEDVRGIIKDHEGRLWAETKGGLQIFDLKTSSYEYFLHDPSNPSSISYNSISSLCCDKSGLVWIGTGGEGIDIFDPAKNQFLTFTKNLNRGRRSVFSIRSILEDNRGYIWIGTDVLYRWNRKTGKLKSYEGPISRMRDFGNSVVYSIVQSDSNHILFGTGMGLYEYNCSTEKAKLFESNSSDPNKIPGQEIPFVFKDQQGKIWVANQNYLCQLIDRRKGIFKRFLYNNDFKAEFSRPCVLPAKGGNFWISSRNGLICFNKNSGSVKRFTYKPDDPNSLNNNFIKSLCPDLKQPDKYLWLGTVGGGLNKFNYKTKTFSHYMVKDGLPNNVVYGILLDKKGYLWLSTNKGISKFNPDSLTFKNYDYSDGLQSNEFNTGAYFKSKSGEMFFGGIKGLNYFYPDEIKDNKFIPNIVITQCEIQNQSTLDKNKLKLINDLSNTDKNLTLRYNENIITFSFAALDYSSPEKNQFEYKMENVDANWIYSGTNHFASYTNLAPGKYTFRVKGSNNNGVWNKKAASFSFIILPPWWKTWWAYSLYLILFLTILLFIRRYELNRVRLKNQLELEKSESNSLRELDQLKSRFFANISHEFRTPLTLILGQIESVISSNIDIKEKGKLQVANRNSQRLLTLINQLLDISKIESGSMKLNAEQHNIVSFLKSLFYSFELIAESKKIHLKFDSESENIPVVYDSDKMEKIFYNLYSNAFKFTPERGEIKTTLRIFDSILEIRIKDTGIGIPEDRIKNIFNRFYQVDSSTTRNYEGTGIGLSLARELIELHNGKINVISKTSEGSEFIISFPLNNMNFEARQYAKVSANRSSSVQSYIEPEEDSGKQVFTKPLSQDEEKIILCVEDSADIRSYVCEQMENEYKVLEASNGEEGIIIAKDNIPNLIITDIMMPKLNGYEFCQAIRADEKTSHIPIIMLTAKAGLDDKIEGLETGADAYITKPFSAKELKVRVKNLINQREQLRKRFSKSTIIKPAEVSAVSVDQEYLRKVIKIIEANFENENFSSERLASEVNMSLSQLNRKLNALIDQPAGQLIRSLRLQRAADLLKQNAGNITEISFMVGFNDHGYFSKLFRKQFGCSPTEYKKKVT